MDLESYYPIDTLHTLNLKIEVDDKINFLKKTLCILNSNLFKFLYQWKLNEEGTVYPQVKKVNIEWLPFPTIDKINSATLDILYEQMLSLNKELQEVSAKFQRTCERKFENLNQNKKLQDWYKLSYSDFIKELSKQKIKLTLSEEADWADYFEQEKNKALDILSKIESTDKEIDQMVYELYGLTEEEIAVVEDAS